jgi:hypothetical protein
MIMQTFLIQTDGYLIPLHDFSFHVLKAIEYQNWFNNETIYLKYNISNFSFHKNNIPKDFIPIGSVEFVHAFLKYHYNIEPKPINIPNELMDLKYTKRNMIIGDENTSWVGEKFVKSMDKIKFFTEIIPNDFSLDNGNYLISDIINIESEWRCFVYNKKLVGMSNYTGDFTMFPDVNLINEMINNYNNCPPAYTLDIGINKEVGTFIIEVHNFYSCGLYGFQDYKILLQMLIEGFNYLIK